MRTLIPPALAQDGGPGVQVKLAQPGICLGYEIEWETPSGWGFLLLS